MTHEELQQLKIEVISGQIPVETALDRMYLACLKEIGQAYDKFQNSTPAPENSV